ncbi:alpha/beta hydrolase family protein [Allokutzneria albata]|uniref:Alpha/beta hydrolase family protein n=1 Tax=Allokutzneria albata TaxID=211114 RepID=A0A1G9WGW0_ALLAB|nr:alpha/beta hydrolase [Allokutzneria albata]SDM83503.1 Alpha/beta hydrolase family protein [Allokutzneria albata]
MADSRDVLSRPAPGPDRTVAYGEHPDHVVDLWFPQGDGPFPVAVVIHGGFWRAAYDRVHTRPMCVALREAGYLVCAPEYRRTGQPGGGWPGTFDDVAAGLEALPELLGPRADLSRVGLIGHSAGGHLALWAASRVPVKGVVSLAGVCDLELASRLRLDDDAVGALLGGTPRSVPDRYEVADPMRLTPTEVPTVLLHGDADGLVPIEASRNYAAQAGPRCDLRELPGTDHFAVIDPLSPAWPEVLRALADVT